MASLVIAAVIAMAVLVTGRVPPRLAAFQVMTLRERVRCFSYWFALRCARPPMNFVISADDPGDDPHVIVSASPARSASRADVLRRVHLLRHLAVLVPIAVVMDFCYPVWIVLAAANGGWPPSLRRFLAAIEQWVVAVAGYGLFITNEAPAFGIAAYGYEPGAEPTTQPS